MACQYGPCTKNGPLYAYEGDTYCKKHFARMAGRKPTPADAV